LIAHQHHDETYTPQVGVCWDYIRNIDLKLQADEARNDSNSPGLLIDPAPGLRPRRGANLFGAAVDCVL
jgi:hypothetical protein